VLVETDGHACLTDFGIATTTGDSSLTTGGALIGSPSYMAPERAYGDEPRPPVDLWSLGATLYAAVEGRPPFARGEAMATMMSVVSEHPAPMLRAGPLEPVLQGLLTKDPAARTDAARAHQQLTAVLAGAPTAPPPSDAPPPVPASLPGATLERLDADDLRALASASRALLTSVARDARDQARYLAGRRRDRKDEDARAPAATPRKRRRFKRRWVVVPLVVTVVVVLLVLVGLGLLVAATLGLL
jgi:eukaryotic-like serine/threonine-protein kinase